MQHTVASFPLLHRSVSGIAVPPLGSRRFLACRALHAIQRVVLALCWTLSLIGQTGRLPAQFWQQTVLPGGLVNASGGVADLG